MREVAFSAESVRHHKRCSPGGLQAVCLPWAPPHLEGPTCWRCAAPHAAAGALRPGSCREVVGAGVCACRQGQPLCSAAARVLHCPHARHAPEEQPRSNLLWRSAYPTRLLRLAARRAALLRRRPGQQTTHQGRGGADRQASQGICRCCGGVQRGFKDVWEPLDEQARRWEGSGASKGWYSPPYQAACRPTELIAPTTLPLTTARHPRCCLHFDQP